MGAAVGVVLLGEGFDHKAHGSLGEAVVSLEQKEERNSIVIMYQQNDQDNPRVTNHVRQAHLRQALYCLGPVTKDASAWACNLLLLLRVSNNKAVNTTTAAIILFDH